MTSFGKNSVNLLKSANDDEKVIYGSVTGKKT